MKAKRIDFTLKNGHKEYDGIAEWDASGALVNCQIMDEDDGFLGDKVEEFLRKGGKVKDGMVLVTDLDTGMVGFFHNQ